MYVKVLSPTCFLWLAFLLSFPLVNSQGQLCYYGPGAEHRAPSEVVPCTNDGNSACCLQGDICLSGNACYNYEHGTTYQYGCTDRAYQDETCPFKCGFDASELIPIGSMIISAHTLTLQDCHLGWVSRPVTTSKVSRTLGSATHPKTVAVSGTHPGEWST